MTTCAIHQPNFMPWMAFFEKISSVDVFVIMTHCQFEKSNYQNRFMMDDVWYSMSVNSASSKELICDKTYCQYKYDWMKIKKRLHEYDNILEKFDDCICPSLAETNSTIIFKVCSMLGINTKIVFDDETNLKSNERLIDICIKNNASEYLAGSGGSKGYLDISLFEQNNIKVSFQDSDKITKEPILKYLKRKL